MFLRHFRCTILQHGFWVVIAPFEKCGLMLFDHHGRIRVTPERKILVARQREEILRCACCGIYRNLSGR
jgi:hypothetical protein